MQSILDTVGKQHGITSSQYHATSIQCYYNTTKKFPSNAWRQAAEVACLVGGLPNNED